MRSLPIYEIERQLLDAVRQHRRLILTAPTGSGKSTQVPQMLLDAGLLDNPSPQSSPPRGEEDGSSSPLPTGGEGQGEGQVVVLQPRRLPARMLAAWVAQDRGGRLGDEVGYQIRLDNVTSPATRIRYVTEGILLRQMLADPNLTGIRAVILDEFHERHLYGDITLARALQIQETARPDLLLIVMSATLDVAAVEKYLQPCAVLSSAGRAFPVAIEYLPKSPGDTPVWELAAAQLARPFAGDALVFMPGAYEISRTVQAIRDRFGSEFIVLPLHGDLPAADQDAAVARYDRRKIVVATNVAETSLTIDGVRLVVDSGLARIPRYDPRRGINTLLVEKISRASADQRAGRAGRTAPGRCLRLWTQREHEQRPAQELPEVKRLDLAEVVLTLKAAGVADVKNFRWLEPPDPRALDRAEQLLLDLGAVAFPSPQSSPPRGEDAPKQFPLPAGGEGQGEGAVAQITELGRRMLAFPVHPRYARMLIAAGKYNCVRPVALIAALTQGRDLLVRGQGRQVEEARDEWFGGETQSDFFVLMRAYRYAERNGFNVERCRRLGIHAQAARQVGPLFEQFLRIARDEGLPVDDAKPVAPEVIQRCVLLGFVDHLARRLDAGTLRCAVVHGRRGVLARESVVRDAPLFVAAEIAEVEGREVNVVLNLATAVREDWLRELFPEDFAATRTVVFDPTLRRVMVQEQRRFRDLVLDEKLSEIVGQASSLSTRNDRSSKMRDLQEAARLLAAEVTAGRCPLKHWDDAVEQWILRVNRLREWMPELELPAIGEADRQEMIVHLCHGATSYKEIKDKPVLPVVKSWLSPQQQQWVEEFAPDRLELPGGRRAKITYAADQPPTVAVLIKDLFDVKEGLWIAKRRVPVTIQILAPNHRPVQVTQNLAGFWRDTYPKLKQELQRQYPRHPWR
jgi:ATP-dependent helicase HrpB